MESVIYLNNAATSFPKPLCVAEAVNEAVRGLPPGQYRSGDETDQSDVFEDCRRLLGKLLGIADAGRIAFSSGATESLNLILQGLRIPAGRIITTVTEHNSVLRPLYNLPGIAGKPILLPCDESGTVDPAVFEKAAAEEKAEAVVLNHCSNVTGAVQDAAAFGEIAKRYGLLFVLDVSQSAGCMEVAADRWQADAVAFTGHKSLLGLSGSGGFYIREGVPFFPAKYGGTGRDSQRLVFEKGEASYEAGTQNTVGICALKAAASWLLGTGTDAVARHEKNLVASARERLRQIDGITLYGPEEKQGGPLISFSANTLAPSDLGYILQSSYRIVTRSGLHCSPLIHRYIGSGDKGTVRISFSPFNTTEEIGFLADALSEIFAHL